MGGGLYCTSLTSVASMGGITGGGGLYYQFDECSQYGGYYRWGDCITSLTSVASMGGITGGGGLYYQFD